MHKMTTLALLMFLISHMVMLSAFEVHVVNSIDDMLSRKYIELRCVLDDSEYGVFVRLQFSIDHPLVHLTSWQHDAIIHDHFIARIKKTKRIITKSFTGQIFFNCIGETESWCKKSIQKSMLYASGFSVSKQGVVRPFVNMIELGVHQLTPKQYYYEVNNDVSDSAHSHSDFLPVTDLAQPIYVVEKLIKPLTYVITIAHKIFFNTLFMWWYTIISVLMVIRILRKKYIFCQHIWHRLPVHWDKDVRDIGLFLTVLGAVYMSKHLIGTERMLIMMTSVCFIGALCVIITPSHENFFIGRCRSLLGFLLSASILPLMIYTILIFYK